ncbi:MAG: HI0074 family nucleotidyltransferase substrate-binding subunit [Candidatus Gastranaerophilaceae bacterium]
MENLDFTALENSLQRLGEVVEIYKKNPQDTIVRDSLIQRFEFTYSITLKALRKYFIERAFIVDDVNKLSFNEMVRTAMQLNLLKSDLAKWTEFREMRNLTSHTYDENVALKVSGIVPDFYEEITYLLKELKGIK